MENAVALLREKVSKAEVKLLRAQKTMETAQTELADLRTALRVFETITGSGASAAGSSGPSAAVLDRQACIVDLLKIGREQGVPPAELYEAYVGLGSEEISIDTFRTTIWRMKDRLYEGKNGALFVVYADAGRYWKQPATDLTEESDEDEMSSMEPNPSFDDPDDPESMGF